MKKYILPALCIVVMASCHQKSEKEIRTEIELELAQKELAEAKEKLAAAEASNTTAPAAQAAPAVSPSTVAPVKKSNGGGTAYGTDFDWLSERYVNSSDLSGQSGSWLRILRNSIYARHGYIFKSADLRQYFGQFAWYTPRYNNVENQLSKIERANVVEIKRWE